MSTLKFITTYQEKVFEDFCKMNWCDMNNFELNIQSYALPVNQQRYILKYFAAYFCEYYHTYEKVIQKIIERDINSTRVMSIGCGCGIDFYALERVLADSDYETFKVEYIGIDAINWQYRPSKREIPFIFENKLVANITAEDISNIDIFTFPKSLTELASSDLTRLGKLIAFASKKSRIFFVNSYITNDPESGMRIDGINQFKNVFDALVTGGYTTSDNLTTYQYLSENDVGLSKRFDFFKIPDEIVDVVKSLTSCCDERDPTEHECKVCNINFWPMMKGKYLAYSIFEFTR